MAGGFTPRAALQCAWIRSADIALIHYADGAKAYILAPKGLTVGMKVMSADRCDPELGNCMRLESIPLGRIGKDSDIADAVAFLAGPEAAYITGQVIRVNGGLLM